MMTVSVQDKAYIFIYKKPRTQAEKWAQYTLSAHARNLPGIPVRQDTGTVVTQLYINDVIAVCQYLWSVMQRWLAYAQCVFDGKDVFVWLPTGFGKSVCYELFLLMFHENPDRHNSLVFIVSPLIPLMVDQVRCLCVSECPYALLKDVHSQIFFTMQPSVQIPPEQCTTYM